MQGDEDVDKGERKKRVLPKKLLAMIQPPDLGDSHQCCRFRNTFCRFGPTQYTLHHPSMLGSLSTVRNCQPIWMDQVERGIGPLFWQQLWSHVAVKESSEQRGPYYFKGALWAPSALAPGYSGHTPTSNYKYQTFCQSWSTLEEHECPKGARTSGTN